MSTLPDRTPQEIRDEVGDTVAARGNIVHVSKSDSNNESEGQIVEDVSRIQSAVLPHNAANVYKVGDLVTFDDGTNNLLYRNIIEITSPPKAFTPSDWEVQPSITQDNEFTGKNSFTKSIDVKGSVKNTDAYVFSDDSTQVEGLIPQSFEWNVDDVKLRHAFPINTQDNASSGLFFRPDGLKMYISGQENKRIYEYDLTIPGDISTASLLQSKLISDDDNIPTSIFFRSDGKKMYMVGGENLSIFEYNLSTPWDISTLDLLQSKLVSDDDNLPRGLCFRPDGKKMYITGFENLSIYEYDLPTPWDISTSILLQSKLVSAQVSNPLDLLFRPDGRVMYVQDFGISKIYEYNLSAPWNIFTAKFQKSFSLAAQDTQMFGFFFDSKGEKLYSSGLTIPSNIFEYDIGTILQNNIQIGTSPERKSIDVKGSIQSEDAYLFSDGSTQAGGILPQRFERNVDDIKLRHVFPVGAQDTIPSGVFLRPDGLKMYMVGDTNNTVFEYDLDIPGDISTAVILQNKPIVIQDNAPQDIFFRHDGKKMYFVGLLNSSVYEYDLPTPWDISTLTFLQSKSLSVQDSIPLGMFIRPDGRKMYISGNDGDEVYEYDLTTPWDISTLDFLHSFSVLGQTGTPIGLFFDPDGSSMYLTSVFAMILKYDLIIPWDVTTAVIKQNISLIDHDNQLLSIYIDSKGGKLYTTGTQNTSIYEYDLGTLLQNNIQIGTSPQRKSIDVKGSIQSEDAYLFSDGSTQAEGAVSFPFGWDVTTSIFLQSKPIIDQDTLPTGIFFRPDGKKMYMVGEQNDRVFEYDLSISWDISTLDILQSKLINLQDTFPQSIFFRPDGGKMYLLGTANGKVYEYDLPTPWDISTLNLLQDKLINLQDTLPTGIFFRPDGKKMYMVGEQNDSVNEYDLSIPWDISTLDILQSKLVSAQDPSPTEVFFRPDGRKMYVVGDASKTIYEYDLSTPWNISTAEILQSFLVSLQDEFPTGLFFHPKGKKMYFVGEQNDSVYEYDLGLKVDGITRNTEQILSDRLQQSQGIQVDLNSVAAATLVLGKGNFFELIDTGGAGSLSFIDGTGWQAGSVIRIINVSGVNITINDGTGSDAIHVTGGVNFSDDDVITLIRNGTQWFETSRS